MTESFHWRRAAGAVLAPFARALTGEMPRIMFFHRVSEANSRATDPKMFAFQLEYLARHFKPTALETFVSHLRSGEPLPKRAVAVTVDDGYRDFGDTIYPLLQRFEIPATLFVVSQFSAGNGWLWFDRLRYICETSQKATVTVEGPYGNAAFPLRTPAQREQTWDRLATGCLTLSPARREELIDQCALAAEVSVPISPDLNHQALSIEALRQLDPDLVTIGAHTRSHPILSTCSIEEQFAEIHGSKRDLEGALSRPVNFFCYPNGQPRDFNSDSVALVRTAGFSAAFTSVSSFVRTGANPLLLPRIGAVSNFSGFRNEINGLTELQSRFRGDRIQPVAGEMFSSVAGTKS